ITSGTSDPGIFKSDTFSTTGLSPGSYSFEASYVSGNYFTGSLYDVGPCEPFTLIPTSGVPEFPLGSLGVFALLGLMIPLLFVMRSRFARNLSI
ncbi:MAG: hypothetical protein ACRDF4_06970, partial [Rhabdochlamydiaceae bacterium]